MELISYLAVSFLCSVLGIGTAFAVAMLRESVDSRDLRPWYLPTLFVLVALGGIAFEVWILSEAIDHWGNPMTLWLLELLGAVSWALGALFLVIVMRKEA